MTNFSYSGTELDAFSLASNWRSYFRKIVGGYIGQDVLEVGAGIGSTTKMLCDGTQNRWLCVEPDRQLIEKIKGNIETSGLPKCCSTQIGTSGDVPQDERFDTVFYVDVLEHIEDDRSELETVVGLMRPGGHLIILSPAHQGLYSALDAKVGHFRRYTKASLLEIMPENMHTAKLMYVDSLGAIASAANRYVLKSGSPTKKQILFWDKMVIPFSRLLDPVLGYKVGKSVVGVWQKNDTNGKPE